MEIERASGVLRIGIPVRISSLNPIFQLTHLALVAVHIDRNIIPVPYSVLCTSASHTGSQQGNQQLLWASRLYEIPQNTVCEPADRMKA